LVWKIEFKESAKKQLYKLNKQWQRIILDYLDDVALLNNPKSRGKPLKGNKKSFWRYRVKDYRILCHIEKDMNTIIVLVIGHRKEVYND
jgi:mRNA interferase RelE/StbE